MGYPWLTLESKRDPEKEWLTWATRMKLDLCGIRISLSDWQGLSDLQRAELHDYPVETGSDARMFLTILTRYIEASPSKTTLTVDEADAEDCWNRLTDSSMPALLDDMLGQWELPLDWDRLSLFGRYVFCAVAGKRDPFAFKSDIEALLSSGEISQLRT